MSIETITCDEFMRLTREEHEEALNQYDTAISKLAEDFMPLESDYEGFANDRDKMARLLTLRKVHQVCLDEQDGEPARSVVAQYQENERNPHQVS